MPNPRKSYRTERDEKNNLRAPMESTQVVFFHPSVGQLNVPIKPDEINWSYGLNTANYPTYGGEVVQILSVFVGDMTIAGTVRSYEQIEKIYKWFTAYMQEATQGRNSASYDMTPVDFHYLARGWKFKIMPTSLPGFKYGRDVVAPTWKLSASVVEVDDSFQNSVIDYANNVSAGSSFEAFGTVTAGIGYKEDNPWSEPSDTTYNLWVEQNKGRMERFAEQLGSYAMDDLWTSSEASKPAARVVDNG